MVWQQEIEEYLTCIQTEIRQSFPKIKSACEEHGINFNVKSILRSTYRQVDKTYREFDAIVNPNQRNDRVSRERRHGHESRERRKHSKRTRSRSRTSSKSSRNSGESTNKTCRNKVSRRHRLNSNQLNKHEDESGVFSIDKHVWVENWRKKCFDAGVVQPLPSNSQTKISKNHNEHRSNEQSPFESVVKGKSLINIDI